MPTIAALNRRIYYSPMPRVSAQTRLGSVRPPQFLLRGHLKRSDSQPIQLSVCLSVCLSLCLSVCLSNMSPIRPSRIAISYYLQVLFAPATMDLLST